MKAAAAESQLPMTPWCGTAGLSEGGERSGAQTRLSPGQKAEPTASSSEGGDPDPCPGPHYAQEAEGGGPAWVGLPRSPLPGNRNVLITTAREVGSIYHHPHDYGL